MQRTVMLKVQQELVIQQVQETPARGAGGKRALYRRAIASGCPGQVAMQEPLQRILLHRRVSPSAVEGSCLWWIQDTVAGNREWDDCNHIDNSNADGVSTGT